MTSTCITLNSKDRFQTTHLLFSEDCTNVSNVAVENNNSYYFEIFVQVEALKRELEDSERVHHSQLKKLRKIMEEQIGQHRKEVKGQSYKPVVKFTWIVNPV